MRNDPLLTTQEAAEMLGVSPLTLKDWRQKKTGPTAIRLGYRTVRYRLSAIRAFIAENEEEV